MPDLLKNILVDDWEHVTKNLLLVTLPAKKNVTSILNEYWEEERMQRPKDSAEYDILEEIIAGTKEYFNKALGRILLYTFERPQYADLRSQWIHKDNMGAADVYGGEHLLRLMGKRYKPWVTVKTVKIGSPHFFQLVTKYRWLIYMTWDSKIA